MKTPFRGYQPVLGRVLGGNLVLALPLGLTVLVVTLAALMATGSGIDTAQERLCEQLIVAFEQDDALVEDIESRPHPAVDHAVMLTYRSRRGNSADAPEGHWISCRFGGGTFTPGRLVLEGVTTDRRGTLTPVQMAMLRIWLRLSGLRVLDPDGPQAAGRSFALDLVAKEPR